MAMGGALDSPLLSVTEVAQLIGRSPDTVRLAINNGRLKARRLGERNWSILKSDFEAWVAAGARTGALNEGTDDNQTR